MRIAIVRSKFRPDGGAEKQTNFYIDACLSLGHDVTLICQKWGDISQFRDVRIVNTPCQKPFHQEISIIVEDEKFDHVIGLEPAPRTTILRLGDGIHEDWLQLKNAGNPLKYLFQRYLSRKHRRKIHEQHECLSNPFLKKVIVNSNFIKNSLLTRYPELKDKVHLIRNITNNGLQTSVESPKQPRFVFLGSGWKRKGLTRAIKLISTDKNAELDVFGADKNPGHYEKLCETLGVKNRIVFKGVDAEIGNKLGKYLGMLSPSFYEPSPNSGLESLACGCPVITSRSNGLRDWGELEGVFSLSDAAWDAPQEGLLSRLIYTISDRQHERERYRTHALQYDTNYLEFMIKELLQ